MKKLYIIMIAMMASQLMLAQTTATNWTKTDCQGNSHTLFNELDSGYVVIMFFEMGCNSCVNGAIALESKVYPDYQKSNPGKIKCYYLDYNSGSNCNDVETWKTSNGFTFPSFADAGSMMSPYGSGMPLIVIAGGKDHKITYKSGWNETKIRTGLNQALSYASPVNTAPFIINTASVFPNPSLGETNINIEMDKTTEVQIELYNIAGQKLNVLYNAIMQAGKQSVSIDTHGLAAGLYYVKINTAFGTKQIPLQVIN